MGNGVTKSRCERSLSTTLRGVRVLSDNEQNSVIDHIREGLQGDAITITHYGEVHYNGTKPMHAVVE